jgi:hypothetical protein
MVSGAVIEQSTSNTSRGPRIARLLLAASAVLGGAAMAAEVPNSIIDLQTFRTTTAVELPGSGSKTVTLTNLNPAVNAWFVLTLSGNGRSYHLENAVPDRQQLRLAANAAGLLITEGGAAYRCDLWDGPTSPLDHASAAPAAYAPLCDGRLYLRKQVAGHRTHLEQMAEYLREKVWCGDAVVGAVKNELFRDAFRESGIVGPCSVSEGMDGPNAPKPASIDPSKAGLGAKPPNLGIRADHPASHGLLLGHWYPAKDLAGIHVSIIQPSAIAPEILNSSRALVNRLDSVEAEALDYLVAFDLAQFDLGFTLGTDHPRLGWSPRVGPKMRNDALAGPDDVASSAPLVRTGMLNPDQARRVAATFTGGFKRDHGAFRYGPLASENLGSHYGFIESGTIFSSLQPGLATLYVLDDGTVRMATWRKADNGMLNLIRSARQNGVALIEPDAATGKPGPGKFVNKWGPGNWSGSASESLRTLRAGACLQETESKRFLIYGYFSTGTPSAMARVFQAYGCQYAMLLDMNALEHTYLAVYVREEKKVAVEHLVAGMEKVDQVVGGQLVPRFVGFPDNRDFFYLLRRERP